MKEVNYKYDESIEKNVLGAFLINAGAAECVEALGILRPEDFYLPAIACYISGCSKWQPSKIR